jgi:hypothetical protein
MNDNFCTGRADFLFIEHHPTTDTHPWPVFMCSSYISLILDMAVCKLFPARLLDTPWRQLVMLYGQRHTYTLSVYNLEWGPSLTQDVSQGGCSAIQPRSTSRVTASKKGEQNLHAQYHVQSHRRKYNVVRLLSMNHTVHLFCRASVQC